MPTLFLIAFFHVIFSAVLQLQISFSMVFRIFFLRKALFTLKSTDFNLFFNFYQIFITSNYFPKQLASKSTFNCTNRFVTAIFPLLAAKINGVLIR